MVESAPLPARNIVERLHYFDDFDDQVELVSGLYHVRQSRLRLPFSEVKEFEGFDTRIHNALVYGGLFKDFLPSLFVDRYEFEDAGDAFALGAFAFAYGKNDWLRELFKVYPNKIEAWAQALYFQRAELTASWTARFANSLDLEHRCVAVRAAVLTGQRFASDIEAKTLKALADNDEDELVANYVSKFRLLPLLKKLYLKPGSKKHILMAYLVLDGRNHVDSAIDYCEANQDINDIWTCLTPYLSLSEAQKLLKSWRLSEKHNLKVLIELLGAQGDPTSIPWLLEQAKNSECENAVARAIVNITGWLASELSMEVKQTDEDDDSDDFDHLIFDHQAAQVLVAKNASSFQAGERYIYGLSESAILAGSFESLRKQIPSVMGRLRISNYLASKKPQSLPISWQDILKVI